MRAKCEKLTYDAYVKYRCRKMADTYAGAVGNMGQSAFDNARNNCPCTP
jgi:hypothetical protein